MVGGDFDHGIVVHAMKVMVIDTILKRTRVTSETPDAVHCRSLSAYSVLSYVRKMLNCCQCLCPSVWIIKVLPYIRQQYLYLSPVIRLLAATGDMSGSSPLEL